MSLLKPRRILIGIVLVAALAATSSAAVDPLIDDGCQLKIVQTSENSRKYTVAMQDDPRPAARFDFKLDNRAIVGTTTRVTIDVAANPELSTWEVQLEPDPKDKAVDVVFLYSWTWTHVAAVPGSLEMSVQPAFSELEGRSFALDLGIIRSKGNGAWGGLYDVGHPQTLRLSEIAFQLAYELKKTSSADTGGELDWKVDPVWVELRSPCSGESSIGAVENAPGPEPAHIDVSKMAPWGLSVVTAGLGIAGVTYFRSRP